MKRPEPKRPESKHLVIGISGATGAIYGIRMLEVLGEVEEVETHLIISAAGKRTIVLETDYSIEEVTALADHAHAASDIAAPISSGSFRVDAMVVAPCTMKTLSGVANSYTQNLIERAADVMLKERRPLILLVRETPLHRGHLRLMNLAAEIGATIVPPMPAFYHRPQSVDDIVNQTVNRVLDLVRIELPEDLFERWGGGGSDG